MSKREFAHYEQFVPLPQCLQSHLLQEASERVYTYVERNKQQRVGSKSMPK